MGKLFFVLLPVFYAAASLAASPVQIEVSAGVSRDDNVARAELDRDIVEDNIINAAVAAAYRLPLNDISYASFKVSLDLNRYQDFDRLNTTRPRVQASYHIKPFAGYTAIQYFVLAAYEQRRVDSDLREGSATDLRLGLSKRLTDRIAMHAGISKEKVSADSSVFEEDNTQLTIGFDYRLTDNHTLYTTISNHDGDIVATATPTQKLIDASWGQIVRDDAFLDLVPARFAYRLTADTSAIRLGDVYAIDSMQAIDGSVFYYSSSAYGNNDYSGMIIDLNYIYRF